MTVDEFYGDNVLAKDVIKSKYLQPNEENIEDMWHRVAKAIASVEEKNKKEWEKKFYNMLEDFKVVPGGRILAGAGIEDKISLTNCISGGSIITTETGKIAISELINYDNYPKILTYDFDRGVNVYEKPDSITLTKRAIPLVLMFKDQRYIKCTEDHKFYVVNKGWTEAQNIEIGDVVYSETKTPCNAELENKIQSDIEEDVYDISMPTNHWFYANELLVHNCYASDIDDCIWEGEDKPSIYKTLVNHALTFKASGGTSANLSGLRPRGTAINNNINQESCGPVGFMELFSVNTATISAGRNRRGALLLGLRVDHPDILEFINVKSDDDLKTVLSKVPEKDRQECWKLLNNYRSVNNANISVMITDEFMQAVQENKEFTLRWAAGDDYVINGIGKEYKKINAKELWDVIMKSNYDNAEPGVLFYDAIKRNFSTQYHSPFACVNPCSEISLPAHGNCNLSSFNLSKYVDKDDLKWDELKCDIETALRFLDNVIDYNMERHPLPQQKKVAKEIRRCGLGFMGLADVFIKLKIKYGSEESIQLTEKISEFFANCTWLASIELAKEKGTFPVYDKEEFMKCEIIQKLPKYIKDEIEKYGVRNSAVNSIQPTGSTSIIAQCSSGLEPIFNKGVTLRRVRNQHDYEKFDEYKVGHPLLIELFSEDDEMPDYVVDAYEVDPFSKVRLQAAIQKYFDGNMSNTINLPKDFPQHFLSKIFMLGWQLGLRGVTVYREGSRMGILEKTS